MTYELILLEKGTGKSWDIAPQVQKFHGFQQGW